MEISVSRFNGSNQSKIRLSQVNQTMRNLLILFTLILTVMFSSTSYAEWTKVTAHVNGNTFYVDLERIRKHGGYVYFWGLMDRLKPSPSGDWSGKTYFQGDCKLFRLKTLSSFFHKEPMGGGRGEVYTPKKPNWRYANPNSAYEFLLKKVCRRQVN